MLRARTEVLFSFLGLRSFDTSMPVERSQERLRRAAFTTVTLLIAKGITALTTLISLALTVRYLGAERYGLWMTIGSLVALLSLADLGLGSGLVNAISEADGRDDRQIASKVLSSAFLLLLVIAALILILFFASYPFIPWPSIFNVASDLAIREAGPAMIVFVVCSAINMPLGVVQRVQMGYQEGFTANLWQIVGSIVGLGGTLFVIRLQAGLPWLVLSMLGGPSLATGLNWLTYFGRVRPWLRPNPRQFEWAAGRSILTSGLLFLVLNLMVIIGTASDNLVIAQFLGASTVAGYAVTQRLFSVTMLAQYVTTPYWPAFSESLTRLDFGWASRVLNRLLVVSMGLGMATAVPLVLLGRSVVAVLAGRELVPSFSLLVGFAVWTLLASFGSAIQPFLNSTTSLLRRQVIYYSLASLSALVLKLVLTPVWQVSGVIWGTVIGYSVFSIIPALRLAQQTLRPRVTISAETLEGSGAHICN